MLQMHKTTSNTLSTTEVHRKAYSIQKDWQLSHNAFSACSKFFNRKEFSCMQFKDKLGLFFIDQDFLPLFTHENYLTSIGGNAFTLSDIEKMATCANYISIGDQVNH